MEPGRWKSELTRVGPLAIAAAVVVAGTAAAIHYSRAGLSLAHYDARAHLVVARRVFDSLTPGWQQVGAVWLPLPHVLNALPVQVDAWYRSGALEDCFLGSQHGPRGVGPRAADRKDDRLLAGGLTGATIRREPGDALPPEHFDVRADAHRVISRHR